MPLPAWHPIETAPRRYRDGLPSLILLREDAGEPHVGYWDIEDECWFVSVPSGKSEHGFPRPTHWAEIPGYKTHLNLGIFV